MEHSPQSDRLNDAGLFILQADLRVVALVALGLGAILAFTKWLRLGKPPSVSDLASGFVALLSLYSALVIGAVFLLTEPPAIDRLEGIELKGVGLVAFVFLFFIGVAEAYSKFIKSESSDLPPRT
jgi:hypothetical protein